MKWLREQVTQRMETARRANEGPWSAWKVTPAWAGFKEDALAPAELACVEDAYDYVMFVALRFGLDAEENGANAAHMALNDPQDVIARCEAELAILDAHAFDTTGKFGSEGPPRCTTCLSDRDGYEEQWEADPWPCQTVRLLASGYRHREGYAEHWPEVNQPAAPSYGYFPPAL